MHPELRAVKLVLTAACNLRCGYCYQSDKNNRRIEWGVVEAALDRLLASKRSDVRLLFIGGEPLLEFPMIERAVAYVEARKRPDMRVRFTVITNGTLLRDRETQFFIDHEFDVQLSFDGVPPAQAQRGKGTFEKLDRLLDRLRAEYPAFYDQRLRVNLTIVPSNVRWLGDSVEYFLLEKRVQELTLNPANLDVPDWKPERISELDEAFRKVFRVSLKRLRETGEVPLVPFRKTGEPRSRPSVMSMCGVGTGDQLAVDVDGEANGCLTFAASYQVFPSIFLKSRTDAMRMGDIRNQTFDERWNAYPAAAKRAEIFDHKELKYSSYGKCGECRYLADCGVCPMSIGRVPGESDPRRVPDFNCAYNLVSLRYRARFPQQPDVAGNLFGRSGAVRPRSSFMRRVMARAEGGV